MREGLQKEEQTAELLVSQTTSQGSTGVTVQNCGFFIIRSHGFLGANQ